MKFYQLSRQARLAQLQEAGALTATDGATMLANTPLPAQVAASMTENQLTQYALPEGLVQDVWLNGTAYQVPLVTEEPSVVAAANNAAKLIGAHGGFQVHSQRLGMIGQIVFQQVPDVQAKAQLLRNKAEAIETIAAQAYPSIYKRGGGLRAQTVTVVGTDFLKLELLVDTKAAMGANMVNRICEAVATQASQWLGQAPLLAILSNNAPQDLTTAKVCLPVAALAKGTLSGATVAQRIAGATTFASLDVNRAVTHNKGIMNGVIGVVQAYGNDTRAISAGVHSYAVKDGRYQPLSQWTVTQDGLVGRLALPLPIGTVGGSIGIVPMAQANQRLGQALTPEIMQAQIVAVGLASNLAALRALVTEGIQKGHMHLQYKSLAIQAGATGATIAWLQDRLAQVATPNLATAQRLLAEKSNIEKSSKNEDRH